MKTKEQELKEALGLIKALVKNVEGRLEALKIEKEDKFADLKEAHKNGAVIQWRRAKDGMLVWEDCHDNNPPTWRPYNEYRIKPEDKFAELKEAYKKGAVIQFRNVFGVWEDVVEIKHIRYDNLEYRIKPEEKPQEGDVCKFWDGYEDEYWVDVLVRIDKSNVPYQDRRGNYYKNAKKLTKEEAIELLFGKEEDNG